MPLPCPSPCSIRRYLFNSRIGTLGVWVGGKSGLRSRCDGSAQRLFIEPVCWIMDCSRRHARTHARQGQRESWQLLVISVGRGPDGQDLALPARPTHGSKPSIRHDPRVRDPTRVDPLDPSRDARPVRVRVRHVLVCAGLAWVVAQVESAQAAQAEFAQVSQRTSSVAWIESVQVAQGDRPGSSPRSPRIRAAGRPGLIPLPVLPYYP